jgi:hypothetical protein
MCRLGVDEQGAITRDSGSYAKSWNMTRLMPISPRGSQIKVETRKGRLQYGRIGRFFKDSHIPIEFKFSAKPQKVFPCF